MLFVYVANRGTTAGSSGDEIGKALASVSSLVFPCLNFRQKEKNLMHTVANSDCGKIGGLGFFCSMIQNKCILHNIPKTKQCLKNHKILLFKFLFAAVCLQH